MTEETTRQFDALIDALHLEQATGKSREELHKEVSRVATLMDLCTVLADVIDSMMLDIEDAMKTVKVPVNDRDRSYFKELRKLVGASRKWAQRATRDTYHSDMGDNLADESDWWKNMILLIEDRTGTDELKSKQVIRWISTMPSQLNMFDIHTRDFIRLTGHDGKQP